MVHHQRFHQWRKGEAYIFLDDEESQCFVFECANMGYPKKKKPRLFYLLLLSLLSCAFVLAPELFGSSSFSLLGSLVVDNEGTAENHDPCSSLSNGTICCDRSGYRTDICIMKGDVRTYSPSSSVFLYTSKQGSRLVDFFSSGLGVAKDSRGDELQHEKIRPYTRKWESSVMATIDELDLVAKKDIAGIHHQCDVWHNVPAVFFSTGGYTGNVYHEFNDGILPLYITSQHFNKEVVFVILEYHDWWIMKYGNILSHLTNYAPIDFTGDRRTHCFPEAIVGLKIHNELTLEPSLMKGSKSIVDFRNVLDRAYWPRIKGLIEDEEREMQLNQKHSTLAPLSQPLLTVKKEDRRRQLKKPKLVIFSRKESRAILNEDSLIKLAEEIGFSVEVLRPDRTTELAKIYRVLNSSDVMIGVHGAAMTHFLFLKPSSVFIQVIPLGTDWAAETYYGEPARKLGLKYIGYKILPRESSLYREYHKSDPVLADPDSVNKKGWEYTKKIYLDSQNVSLDMRRFRMRLLQAYDYSFSKINWRGYLQPEFSGSLD